MLAEAEKAFIEYKQLRLEELRAEQVKETIILLGEDKKAFPEYQQRRQDDIQAIQEFLLIVTKFLDTTIINEQQIAEENEKRESALIQDHN